MIELLRGFGEMTVFKKKICKVRQQFLFLLAIIIWKHTHTHMRCLLKLGYQLGKVEYNLTGEWLNISPIKE